MCDVIVTFGYERRVPCKKNQYDRSATHQNKMNRNDHNTGNRKGE
jgi:hypothetical protein